MRNNTVRVYLKDFVNGSDGVIEGSYENAVEDGVWVRNDATDTRWFIPWRNILYLKFPI